MSDAIVPRYLIHPLDGPRRKLEWAKHHLDTLDARFNALLEFDPIVIPPQFDAANNVTHFRFQIPLLDQVEFGLVAGDSIHCMRASLDHLAWQLAGKNAKEHVTGFPIFLKPNEGRFEKMTTGMPGEAIEVIRDLQPVPFGELFKMPAELHPLALLHDLDRVDKHQTLTVVTQGVEWRLPKVYQGRWITIDKNTVQVALPGKAELPPDFKPSFAFSISFGPPLGGFQVLGNLGLAHSWIDKEVFPRFERFFPKRESAGETSGG